MMYTKDKTHDDLAVKSSQLIGLFATITAKIKNNVKTAFSWNKGLFFKNRLSTNKSALSVIAICDENKMNNERRKKTNKFIKKKF